jgi:hypothetical protein
VDDQIEIGARRRDVQEVAPNDLHFRAVDAKELRQELESDAGVIDGGHMGAGPAAQREEAIVRPAGTDLVHALAGQVTNLSSNHAHERAVTAESWVDRR